MGMYAQGTKVARSHLCSFANNTRNTFSKEKHQWLLLDIKNLCWAHTSNTLLLKVQEMWPHTNLCVCVDVFFNFFFLFFAPQFFMVLPSGSKHELSVSIACLAQCEKQKIPQSNTC